MVGINYHLEDLKGLSRPFLTVYKLPEMFRRRKYDLPKKKKDFKFHITKGTNAKP